MSEYEADNQEDSSIFKSKECSSSIFYENTEVFEELSKVVFNDQTANTHEENMNQLNEKNELQNDKKHETMTNELLKESFDESKIKSTDAQLKFYLSDENYQKLKSNEIKEEDDIYLKIEDFPENPISEIFIYEEAVDKIKSMIDIFEKELKSIKIKNLKLSNIKEGKRLEIMIENIYLFDKNLKEQMIEELCFLKRIINCWRAIAQDGNRFYRSIIFSWLEYLIFNKKTNILKIIISNLYIKFDVSNEKIKNLPFQLKKQFTSDEKYTAITLLEIIIRFIEKDNIEEAYLTLIKGFNVTRTFDRVMIFYLRYLLYEYILDNQNKLFKKDFPFLLGNLLPKEYATSDGKFLYNDYFMNNLLIFFKYEENLAIYLIPYVLKINLNIVFYLYGKDCEIETKFFSCELPNKEKKFDTINILYTKAHYDICYYTEYYNKYKKLLELYCKINTKYKVDDFYILDPIDEMKKEKELNKLFPFDENKSVLFNRILYNKEQNKKNDDNKNKKENNTEDKLDINEAKKYTKYIYEGIINNKNDNTCFICNKNIAKENNKEILPCNCSILFCSDECKNNYYKYLTQFFKTMDFNINIKCGKCNNNINRTKFFENFCVKDEKVKKALKNKMIEYFNMYCMNCLNVVGNNNKTIRCKCQQLYKLLDTNKFEHKLCEKCKEISTTNCKICNLLHSRLMS